MTQMPFKEYLASEGRMLGIKPNSVWMRIFRGKHPKPEVAKQVGKRIMLVISADPRHARWMKHQELVQAAMDAVRAVYADQSVTKLEVEEGLQKIKELIEVLQNQILIS